MQLLENLGIDISDVGEWRFVRSVEEPEFGPDSCVRTCFISGKLLNTDQSLQGHTVLISLDFHIFRAYGNSFTRFERNVENWKLKQKVLFLCRQL